MRPGCTGQAATRGLAPKPIRPAYPRRPAEAFVVHVDVDGTMLVMRDPDAEIPYSDGDALQRLQMPYDFAVHRVKSLEQAGFHVRFVTGRGEDLRDATVAQLEGLGFRDVSDRLAMQDAWTTWEALEAHKRDENLDWNAVLSIGDQDVDMRAATAAGTPFLHVDDFAAGESLDGTFCWQCGCTALRACQPPCAWANGRVCTTCARGGSAALDDFAEVVA